MAKAIPPSFEKSPMDREPKGMREGSKAERALDKKQAKSPLPKAGPKIKGLATAFKGGGVVGKKKK